jgi:hypothetical protein
MRLLTATLAFVAFATSAAVFAADETTFVAPRQADELVSVQNVTVHDGVTSGELVNRADHPIHDVVLIVQYKYQWPNEWKPGEESPGRSDKFTVRDTVQPGASFAFTAPEQQPPLPANGGRYDTVVRVLSFDEAIPPAPNPPT